MTFSRVKVDSNNCDSSGSRASKASNDSSYTSNSSYTSDSSEKVKEVCIKILLL